MLRPTTTSRRDLRHTSAVGSRDLTQLAGGTLIRPLRPRPALAPPRRAPRPDGRGASHPAVPADPCRNPQRWRRGQPGMPSRHATRAGSRADAITQVAYLAAPCHVPVASGVAPRRGKSLALSSVVSLRPPLGSGTPAPRTDTRGASLRPQEAHTARWRPVQPRTARKAPGGHPRPAGRPPENPSHDVRGLATPSISRESRG